MNNEILAAKLKELAALKAQKSELSIHMDEIKTDIELKEREVISLMMDMSERAGLENPMDFNVTVDGRRYGLNIKPYYDIRAEDRPTAFNALRTLGLGDLIVERVDARALTKALTEYQDEDGMLPEHFDILPVQVFNKTTISDRKVAR